MARSKTELKKSRKQGKTLTHEENTHIYSDVDVCVCAYGEANGECKANNEWDGECCCEFAKAARDARYGILTKPNNN